jgi:hypothetical protein
MQIRDERVLADECACDRCQQKITPQTILPIYNCLPGIEIGSSSFDIVRDGEPMAGPR